MRIIRCAVLAVLAMAGVYAADPAPETPPVNAADKADARQRQFATLQKDLEAAKPDENATEEQINTFLELCMDGLGKFAKEHSKTAEGFEAATMIAGLLGQLEHPRAQEFALLATEAAPATGVDVKRVAMAWALVVKARVQDADIVGAKKALENIKPLDNEYFTQISAQLEQIVPELDALKAAKEQAKVAEEQLQVGKEPFAIDEKDINGNAVSLAALKGKVVVIDFWAPWCGPCMAEMPSVVAMYNELKPKGLEIVGISLDKDLEELKTTLAEEKMTWPIISDHAGWQNAIAKKWGVRSIPKMYVLDRKGVIRHTDLRGAALQKAVAALLEEK